MKKFILIVLLIFLFVPINVFGLELHVADTKAYSNSKGIITLDGTLSMENWGTIDTSNTGAYIYMIGLEYESKDVMLLGAQADKFITTVYNDSESDMTIIILTYGGSQNTSCAYGFLSCDNTINIKINFQLINSNCDKTIITMDEALAMIFTVTSLEKGEIEVVDILENSYYFEHKVEFANKVNITQPKTTTKMSTIKIDSISQIKTVKTTKKITTKTLPSTKKVTSYSTTKSSSTVNHTTPTIKDENISIRNDDIVDKAIKDSKNLLERLKDKDTQKELIKYVLIALVAIILLIILVKLKNHKLNKKFKDF